MSALVNKDLSLLVRHAQSPHCVVAHFQGSAPSNTRLIHFLVKGVAIFAQYQSENAVSGSSAATICWMQRIFESGSDRLVSLSRRSMRYAVLRFRRVVDVRSRISSISAIVRSNTPILEVHSNDESISPSRNYQQPNASVTAEAVDLALRRRTSPRLGGHTRVRHLLEDFGTTHTVLAASWRRSGIVSPRTPTIQALRTIQWGTWRPTTWHMRWTCLRTLCPGRPKSTRRYSSQCAKVTNFANDNEN